jgi:hypothetical protein
MAKIRKLRRVIIESLHSKVLQSRGQQQGLSFLLSVVDFDDGLGRECFSFGCLFAET